MIGMIISERDRKILEGVRDGKTNTEIAKGIGLAPNSVRIYVSQLYNKIAAENRTHLVSVAIATGLIAPTKPQKKARTAF